MLRQSEELFLLSQERADLKESLRLEMEAMSLQTQAVHLLQLTDRQTKARLDEQKKRIERQRAELNLPSHD